MRLHLPTLSQILALFFTSADVSSIMSNIDRQVDALRDAVDHHLGLADFHTEMAGEHYKAAAEREEKAEKSQAEAARAGRVADKLAKLVA